MEGTTFTVRFRPGGGKSLSRGGENLEPSKLKGGNNCVLGEGSAGRKDFFAMHRGSRYRILWPKDLWLGGGKPRLKGGGLDTRAMTNKKKRKRQKIESQKKI